MKPLIIIIVALFLGGCSLKAEIEWGQGATNVVPPQSNGKGVLNEDMRNPDTRAAVDELIAKNALSDRNNPMPAPDTAYDLPLPEDMQGMACEPPPVTEGNARPTGPLFADRAYMGTIVHTAIPGPPPWMEEVSLLECGIEDVLTPEMVSGWLKDPNEGEGLWVIGFDRNGDKSADAWVQLYEGSRYPRYYGFDRSFNHEVNIIYEDTQYATRTDDACQGIAVYQTAKDTYAIPKQGA